MLSKVKCLVTLTVAVAVFVASALAEEELVPVSGDVRWTGGSFEWPCTATKNMFKNSGRYVSKNVIASRAAIFNDDAIVALPRWVK